MVMRPGTHLAAPRGAPPRRRTDLIVIHCAATKPDLDVGADEIRTWHMGRGWRDIGYHHVIRRDGTIESGRPAESIGAHARGYNGRSVGICLVGGLGFDGRPAPAFTNTQWLSLARLVDDLRARYPDARVLGHRDLDAQKACPSFDVATWLRQHAAGTGGGEAAA